MSSIRYVFGLLALVICMTAGSAGASESSNDDFEGPAEGEVVEGPSDSNNDSACGAVLCLFGEMVGQRNQSGCDEYEKDYFSIRVYRHGKFDEGKTAEKRLEFLNKCPSSVPATRELINGIYGPQYDGP